MTPAATISASANLMAQLVSPAVRALALGCAAGLGLAVFRVRSTSVRLFTWSTVLYAALAMPLLERALPPLPIPTPAFLQLASTESSATGMESSHPLAIQTPSSTASEIPAVRPHSAAMMTSSPSQTAQRNSTSSSAGRKSPTAQEPYPAVTPAHSPSSLWSSFRWSAIQWSAVAAVVYLAVTFLFLVRFFVGLTLGRRLRRTSRRIYESRLTVRLARRAYALRLAYVPQAAESECISVPVTMGGLRSIILLPASWREWDDTKLDAVVAHEVSHVMRRDAFTQRVSLLHRAIFWFSPLAWWLDRHLADLAEQASDEAALSSGADCKDYAQTLLGFFEALQASPGRVWWQGVSMAKAGQAERRVERILAWKGAVTMGLKRSVVIALVTLAIPVLYLAASARPALRELEPQHLPYAQSQTAPPENRPAPAPKAQPDATPAPEVAPAPEATPEAEVAPPEPAPAAIAGTVSARIQGVPAPAAVAAVPPTIGANAYAPISPMVPRAAIAPPAPAAWRGQSMSSTAPSRSSSSSGSSYAYGYDDEDRFVIASGKTDSLTMSGSTADARHVEKLKKTIAGDFIWFQRDEKSYIIRDQATIDRARKFWAPQEELGKKQEELGKRQEALGKQQEELGSKMEQVHVKIPDMTAQLDKLRAELKQLSSGATMEQVGDLQSEIGELQSKIGEIQSQAGEQQGKLGEQQGALGEQQGKLGEEQGKLGEQQAELAEQANRQMKQLLDEAIKNGTAQPDQN
jgi:beta-lactamase regulating signal transducer with metallopeptidase domain